MLIFRTLAGDSKRVRLLKAVARHANHELQDNPGSPAARIQSEKLAALTTKLKRMARPKYEVVQTEIVFKTKKRKYVRKHEPAHVDRQRRKNRNEDAEQRNQGL